MVDSLTRMWVLIGFHLNARAQAQLVGLLPTELSTRVSAQLRAMGGDDEMAEWGEPSPAEQRVLDGFRRRREPEEGEEVENTDDDIEHSPLCAALLSLVLLDALAPPRAAALLVELPLRFQGQIIHLIVTSSVFSATWGLQSDERDLVEAMRQQMTTADRWGVLPACEILRAIDTTRRLRRAVSSAAEVDEEAVTILQNHLFVFSDVLRLTDRELQVLLNRVANKPLARALTDTPDAVRDRLLSNVSPRRARIIEEESEFLGELTPEEIQADQRDILETVRRLQESGDISTYFGSVRSADDLEQVEESAEGADGDSEQDLSLIAEPEPELGAPPASGRPQRDKRPANGESRRLLMVVASVAGIGLLALVVLMVSKLQDGGEEDGSRSQRTSSARAGQDGQVLMRAGAHRTQAENQDTDDGAAALETEMSAIIEFAGKSGETTAQVRVDEGSQVDPVEAEMDSTGKVADDELYLRLGRVSCAVIGEIDTFVVRSPLVTVHGLPGSVFAVRVVLDASTTVFVERGGVQVEDRWGEAAAILTTGERQRFEP